MKDINFCTTRGCNTEEMSTECWYCLDRPEAEMGWADSVRRQKRRKSMVEGINKYSLDSRIEWINGGTILVDNEYYYYTQKKKTRKKGTREYHKVRNFTNFFNKFLKRKT